MAELTFPTLEAPEDEAWRWPAPPFARWRVEPVMEAQHPCVLQTPSGDTLEGELLGFRGDAGRLTFRYRSDGKPLALPFSRFSRLSLAEPIGLADPNTGVPLLSLPLASEQRSVRLSNGARVQQEIVTLGELERPEGLYLYEPVVSDECQVRAVFVPRSAYTRCDIGPTALDWAAEHWISEPDELLQAIARQQRMTVLPLGHALRHLGLATQEQLEHALAQPMGDIPLGERLVALRVISEADLQSAIAHKMGFPIVDLTRFPIDPNALRTIPVKVAIACRCVPLLLDGKRLIVAVDRPQRLDKLRERHVLPDLQPVPVIASRAHIKAAFADLVQQDAWAGSVGLRPGFFPTTR